MLNIGDIKGGHPSSALLIITGAGLDIDDVLSELGEDLAMYWRKGERKSTPLPGGEFRYFDSIHAESGYKMWPDPSTNDSFIKQLAFWVSNLPNWSDALQRWKRQGAAVELNCALFTDKVTSFAVAPGALRVFADASVELKIAFFPQVTQRTRRFQETMDPDAH